MQRSQLAWREPLLLLIAIYGALGAWPQLYSEAVSVDGRPSSVKPLPARPSTAEPSTAKPAAPKPEVAATVLNATGPVKTVVFSWDSKFVVAGTYEQQSAASGAAGSPLGRVFLWEVQTGKLLRRWAAPGPVTTVLFSHDGQRVMAASGGPGQSGAVQIWNVHTSRLLGTHREPTPVASLALSPDDKVLVMAARGPLLFLDPKDATVRGQFVKTTFIEPGTAPATPIKSYEISALTFGWGSAWLAGLCTDSRIRIWDIQNVQLLSQWQGPSAGGLILTGLNQEVITADCDITYWDVHTTHSRGMINGPSEMRADTIALSPGGAVLAAGTGHCVDDHRGQRMPVLKPGDNRENAVQLWHMQTMAGRLLNGHRRPVDTVAFAPNGQWLASGSADKTVRLWPKSRWDVKTDLWKLHLP